MNYKRFLLLIIPFAVIPSVFFLLVYAPPLYIFPVTANIVHSFGDSLEGGHSQIHAATINDKVFSIRYTLRKGYPYPYAGMTISPGNEVFYPDFSKYDYMELKLFTSQSQSIQLFLEANEPGITKKEKPTTLRYVLYEVPVYQKRALYTLWLKDFKTPIWWYSRIGIPEKKIGNVHWDNIEHITFSSSAILPVGVKDEMIVKGIVLKKSYSFFLIMAASCTFFYYLIFILMRLYRRRINKTITKIIPYKELTLTEVSDKNLNKIIEYISTHYKEEGLALAKISKDTGISTRDISDYIKKEYQLNFKQYLNGIRMHEAKRLLKNSSLSVSEIAYKIGFSNVTHFNRTFRQYCDCSPLNYRTDQKQFD